MRTLIFVFLQAWSAGTKAGDDFSIEDLSRLFEKVTDYEKFTSNVNIERSSSKDENYYEKFQRLIDFLQRRRDTNLSKLKNHLIELKRTVEASLKNGTTKGNRPVWPTCCGRNGDLSIFTPELKMSAKHLKHCQAPIDPSSKGSIIFFRLIFQLR